MRCSTLSCVSSILLLSFCLALCSAQPLPLPSLPYDYNALEPYLTEAAMKVHHLGHHQAYTDKLNVALRELRERGPQYKALAKLGIDTVLSRLNELPEDLRTPIRNNGGGYVNHDLYFRMLSSPTPNNTDGTAAPARVPTPTSKIASALVRDFGSFEAFQKAFTDKAAAVFGSGWVFLYIDSQSQTLKLLQTPNQDNPNIMTQDAHHVSLLCVDVWEHAYYLNFQNKRNDFLQAFWNLVNWDAVDQSYQSFLTYAEIMKEMNEKRQPKKKDEL